MKVYEFVEDCQLLEGESPVIVILDHLEDPHNFGAIIRTCEAAGVDAIIIPKNNPHKTKFQLAPCQMPVSAHTTIIFLI